jgi:hypothetical protein
MKRLAIIVALLLSFSAYSQRKVALIIAIAEYKYSQRWKGLATDNDVKYMKAALMLNGFSEKDIDTLKNKAATKAAILKALDDLYAKVQAGDIVVFQFSGHGQQIYDNNGDETDGYDEAMIPYDADGIYSIDYKGDKHLRDDELGDKLNKIRAKIGATGSLVAIIDACHSGTATRGTEIPHRGSPTPFIKPGYVPQIKIGFASNQEEFFNSKEMGNMICFFASAPNQVNYEAKDLNGQRVGSLTYGLAKGLSELRSGSNYQMLFEKVKAFVQANCGTQIPTVEGNIEQEIFGGKYIPMKEIVSIQNWVNDSTFYMSVGLLNNVSRGAKFKVYALNDVEETTPMAEGYVTAAGSFQSIGIINKKLVKGEAYRVKVDETNYGDFAASLLIRKDNNKQHQVIASQIQQFIAPYQYLSISDSPDFVLAFSTKGGDTLKLIDRTDSVRWYATYKKGDTLSHEALKAMLDNIKTNMRVNYMKNLPDGGSFTQQVTIEVIINQKVELGLDRAVKPKDVFQFKITNNSPYDLYYTLVDIMPTDEVDVLFPYGTRAPGDFIVAANSAPVMTEEIEIEDKPGKEYFKFIFTKTPIDLRNVFSRKRTRSVGGLRSVENVFDDMFKDSNDEQGTRAIIKNVKVDEVGVITRTFTITRG